MGESNQMEIEIAVNNDEEDNSPIPIPCSKCGKDTYWDSIYGDLCYRCIRAPNE